MAVEIILAVSLVLSNTLAMVLLFLSKRRR